MWVKLRDRAIEVGIKLLLVVAACGYLLGVYHLTMKHILG